MTLKRFSHAQRAALAVLLASREQRLTSSAIAAEVGISSPASAARTCNVLMDHGLVAYGQTPSTGRVGYALTDAGRRVAAELVTA